MEQEYELKDSEKKRRKQAQIEFDAYDPEEPKDPYVWRDQIAASPSKFLRRSKDYLKKLFKKS